eukprot:8541718-Pyramimonas_sp.AAC.1
MEFRGWPGLLLSSVLNMHVSNYVGLAINHSRGRFWQYFKLPSFLARSCGSSIAMASRKTSAYFRFKQGRRL